MIKHIPYLEESWIGNRYRHALKGIVPAKIIDLLVVALFLNPDFAVEIVMRVSNTIQISDSGYFFTEVIVNYFKAKIAGPDISGF